MIGATVGSVVLCTGRMWYGYAMGRGLYKASVRASEGLVCYIRKRVVISFLYQLYRYIEKGLLLGVCVYDCAVGKY